MRGAFRLETLRRLALVVIIGMTAATCDSNPRPSVQPTTAAALAPSTPAAAAAPAISPQATTAPVLQTIPQPVVPDDVQVAPDSTRVDLAMPSFTNPTDITNPLFPVSAQRSVLMLGKVEGKPFRTEVTLLPYTRIVVWNGMAIETAVSQYQAYLDGRIQELAYDLYAQADDGSVWYFGEDVADLADGAIVSKEGTWLAGKDAPAAMIMPAHPRVGDVFRTENSPGFAFEEVTVKAIDRLLEGPLGPIEGGLIISELHLDGSTEDKTFAPGYGEFLTMGGGDIEALALAVPTDAANAPQPAALHELELGARQVLDASGSKDWPAAVSGIDAVTAAWQRFEKSAVPRLVEPRLSAAIQALHSAVERHDQANAPGGAIEVARLALDIELRYRPVTEIDLARRDLWAAQVLVDAAGHDAAGINGDAFTLVAIRDRILGAVGTDDLTSINSRLLDLQIAATDENLAAAVDAARGLRTIVAGIESRR